MPKTEPLNLKSWGPSYPGACQGCVQSPNAYQGGEDWWMSLGESIWFSFFPPDSEKPSLPNHPLITQPLPTLSWWRWEQRAMELNSGGCFLVKSTEANMMEKWEGEADWWLGATEWRSWRGRQEDRASVHRGQRETGYKGRDTPF